MCGPGRAKTPSLMRSISHLPVFIVAAELAASCTELPSSTIQETRNDTAAHVQATADTALSRMPLWDAVKAMDDFALQVVEGSSNNFDGYSIIVDVANDMIVQILMKTPDGKKFVYRHDIEGVKVLDGDSGIVLFASGIQEEDAPPDSMAGDPEVARQILSNVVQALQ